ncbi:unannotated protein [freshwater metagenome]|uniref:Unannotated protein n=1 Tax=freshwater metagenome TaxID=449393 RepID=A0A6J6KLL4_9ZZZZ
MGQIGVRPTFKLLLPPAGVVVISAARKTAVATTDAIVTAFNIDAADSKSFSEPRHCFFHPFDRLRI